MADLLAARRDLSAFAELAGRPMTPWQARALELEQRLSVIVSPAKLARVEASPRWPSGGPFAARASGYSS